MSLEELATGVHGIIEGPLPAEVHRWARAAISDTAAVMVGGTSTDLFTRAASTVTAHPGPRPVPGLPGRTASASWSAHLGAVAASALDFDDGHYRGGGIHASSTVLPVLLAGAGSITLSRLTRAFVAGHEVAVRAGFLNSPAHSGESYRASGYAATIGAAAALIAARGGDVADIASAVRLASAYAPHSRMTSTAARESIGWAAATAVAVTELAEAGFTSEAVDRSLNPPAGPTPFEDAPDDPFIGAVGQRYECLTTYVKPWPCCRAAHSMIEVLLHVECGTRTIDEIEVHVTDGASVLDVVRPSNLSEAQYALPWLAGVVLVRGQRGVEHLRAEDFTNPEILEVASKVRLRPGRPPTEDGYPSRVHVSFSDGSAVDQSAAHDLGSASRPLSPQRMAAKRRGLLASTAWLDANKLSQILTESSGNADDLLTVLGNGT